MPRRPRSCDYCAWSPPSMRGGVNWDPFEGADEMEAQKMASETMSEAEREQGIQLARTGIARGRRQYDEAIRDPQSVSERLARATGNVAATADGSSVVERDSWPVLSRGRLPQAARSSGRLRVPARVGC